MTETIKGYWLDVENFVKAKGRYPNDENELNAYYKYTPTGEEPIYIKPHDTKEDEVILWSRQTTLSGKKIGVKASGLVVKEDKNN